MAGPINPSSDRHRSEDMILINRDEASQDYRTSTVNYCQYTQRHGLTTRPRFQDVDKVWVEAQKTQVDSNRMTMCAMLDAPIHRVSRISRDTRRKDINAISAIECMEKERERRRLNQQRYRKKQNKYLAGLEDDVEKLMNELEHFEVQRHYMELGIPTKQTVWNVATEYFRLFQCGVVPGAHLNFAFNFLKKTMSPDVTNGFECGPEALLENWRLISLYFNGITVRLNRLVEVGTRSVVAITATSITITPVTLQFAFPHLNSDGSRDAEGQKRMIAHELIGKTLVLRGSVCFQWDSMAERVTAIYSQSDLLTPLLHLLGSLQSVARVFEQARVTPELMPMT